MACVSCGGSYYKDTGTGKYYIDAGDGPCFVGNELFGCVSTGTLNCVCVGCGSANFNAGGTLEGCYTNGSCGGGSCASIPELPRDSAIGPSIILMFIGVGCLVLKYFYSSKKTAA